MMIRLDDNKASSFVVVALLLLLLQLMMMMMMMYCIFDGRSNNSSYMNGCRILNKMLKMDESATCLQFYMRRQYILFRILSLTFNNNNNDAKQQRLDCSKFTQFNNTRY